MIKLINIHQTYQKMKMKMKTMKIQISSNKLKKT